MFLTIWQVHSELRKWLQANTSPEVAATTRIIYGGIHLFYPSSYSCLCPCAIQALSQFWNLAKWSNRCPLFSYLPIEQCQQFSLTLVLGQGPPSLDKRVAMSSGLYGCLLACWISHSGETEARKLSCESTPLPTMP